MVENFSTFENEGSLKLSQICQASGLSKEFVTERIQRLNVLIHNSVSVKNSITVVNDVLYFKGIAGILNLAKNFQVEIIPKFVSSENKLWQNDFFAIALLTKYGRIFSANRVGSSKHSSNLYELLARTLVLSIQQGIRKPIRLYKKSHWKSFNIEGEVPPEDFKFFSTDGFSQSGLVLSRDNEFNSNIASALIFLRKYISDCDLDRSILRIVDTLGPQSLSPKGKAYKKTSSRHSNWEEANELSHHINSGGGLSLKLSDLNVSNSPGFIINTAQTWEKLLYLSMKYAGSNSRIEKRPFLLGKSLTPNPTGFNSSEFSVTPDIYVEGKDNYLMDAKYKDPEYQFRFISSPDVYESLAFMQGAKTSICFLIYPDDSALAATDAGSLKITEIIEVNKAKVIACKASTNGFSEARGFNIFSNNVFRCVEALYNEHKVN